MFESEKGGFFQIELFSLVFGVVLSFKKRSEGKTHIVRVSFNFLVAVGVIWLINRPPKGVRSRFLK